MGELSADPLWIDPAPFAIPEVSGRPTSPDLTDPDAGAHADCGSESASSSLVSTLTCPLSASPSRSSKCAVGTSSRRPMWSK
jgi:hypothetical protein